MKKFFFALAIIAALGSHAAAADALPATYTTDPAQLVVDLPFDLTISTADLGDEVYLFTWCHGGPAVSWGWNDSMTPKFRMSGSGGTYTIHIESIRQYYGLTDANITTLKQLGFIARNAAGQQTVDLIADVLTTSGYAYSGGAGTADSPYLLSTAADVEALQATAADWHKHFRLGADITLAAGTPIGTELTPFSGSFDGASHVITGYRHTAAGAAEPSGLFGCVDGATICDLGLRDVNCSGGACTGALAGVARGASVIERCYATGSVTGSSVCTGGLVGDNRGAAISDCYSSARVTSAGYAAGGLTGKNSGSVARCYATGDVNAQGGYAGGIAGANYGDVSQCVAVNPVVISGSAFTGRAGGNANARNGGHSNLSWITTTNTLGWGEPCYGDHAEVCSSESLRQREAYTALGWDFDTVWEWRSDDGRGWPALRGLAAQQRPMPDALYGTTGTLPSQRVSALTISVADGAVSIHSAGGLRSVSLLDVTGTVAAVLPCHGQTQAIVPLTQLPAGIYLLRAVMTDGSCETAKIANY